MLFWEKCDQVSGILIVVSIFSIPPWRFRALMLILCDLSHKPADSSIRGKMLIPGIIVEASCCVVNAKC